MFCPILREISNREDSATKLEPNTIFDKYKQGRANSYAPFRLFETNCTPSEDEDSLNHSHSDRKIRGPYRRYTME